MRNFFKSLLIATVLVVSFASTASAQSQDDINPQFNASSEDFRVVNLNYDCSNLDWPFLDADGNNVNDIIGIYRKLYLPSPNLQDIYYTNPRFKDSDFVKNRLPYAESYYVYAKEDSLSIEREIDRIMLDNNRIVPQPFILTQEEWGSALGSNPKFENYIGRIFCDLGGIRDVDGNLVDAAKRNDTWQASLAGNTGYFKSMDDQRLNMFRPANLIPPTLQQVENIIIDIIYLVWALLGVVSILSAIWIGFKIFYNSYSPEQIGDTYRSLAIWIISIILALIAIPTLNSLYGWINISTSKCFVSPSLLEDTNGDGIMDNDEEDKLSYDLTMPGFTLFFKDACTGPKEFSN